jgi:hypothetical protein
MTIKERIVSTLLRIYSASWRHEYGGELSHLLLIRPLSVAAFVDVLWNGARQRVRSFEPSTIIGLAAMLVIIAGFAQNIVAPLPYVRGAATSLLQPSMMILPTLVVAPMKSNLYVLALIVCGRWTYLRSHGSISPGIAAIRMSLIAGFPVMLAAILMVAGVLATTAIGPADTPTTFQQHGFTFTFYAKDRIVPSAWSILMSPLFQLPLAWLWGTIGGRWGLNIARRQHASA